MCVCVCVCVHSPTCSNLEITKRIEVKFGILCVCVCMCVYGAKGGTILKGVGQIWPAPVQ